MRKFFAVFVIFLLFFSANCMNAFAEDIDAEQREALEIDKVESALPGEAKDILGDMSVTDSLDVDSGISKILDAAMNILGGIFKAGLKSAVVIMIVVILCSLAGSVYDGGMVPDYVPLGGALAIAAVAAGDINSFIGLGTETLQSLSDFSKVLLPTLATAGSLSGAITSASAKYAATALFMDVLITASTNIIMPMVYAYLAAVLADAAAGGEALRACSKLIKSICTTALTALVIIFTTYLSITGVITGSADVVTTRLAKTTISTALPVVGGIISDAAGTLVAGASVLRNSVGIFGMLAVISVCITPVLTLGIQYLLYKVAAGLASTMTDSRLTGLISGIGSAFGMVLALVGAGAIMLFISIISSVKAVTGL
jgi:stage III sporulation protein AE